MKGVKEEKQKKQSGKENINEGYGGQEEGSQETKFRKEEKKMKCMEESMKKKSRMEGN